MKEGKESVTERQRDDGRRNKRRKDRSKGRKTDGGINGGGRKVRKYYLQDEIKEKNDGGGNKGMKKGCRKRKNGWKDGKFKEKT